MPLLDHFHPPLSQRRHWESFHAGWAEALVQQLNQGLLPPRYFAESQVQIGARVEVDVGTFSENGASGGTATGVAFWAPAQPALDEPLHFSKPETFEVRVFNDEEGPRLVAAIELVSPANKDRPAHRQQFAIKCASYLLHGISLIVVDVVTERKANLHNELLNLLQAAGQANHELYAAAYRTLSRGEGLRLQAWCEALSMGKSLPVLPLWINEELSLPLDLEAAYVASCSARRIA